MTLNAGFFSSNDNKQTFENHVVTI